MGSSNLRIQLETLKPLWFDYKCSPCGSITEVNPCDPIRDAQNPCEPIRDAQKPCDPIRDAQKPCDLIRNAQNPCDPIRDARNPMIHLEMLKTLVIRLQTLKPVWFYYRGLWSHMRCSKSCDPFRGALVLVISGQRRVKILVIGLKVLKHSCDPVRGALVLVIRSEACTNPRDWVKGAQTLLWSG